MSQRLVFGIFIFAFLVSCSDSQVKNEDYPLVATVENDTLNSYFENTILQETIRRIPDTIFYPILHRYDKQYGDVDSLQMNGVYWYLVEGDLIYDRAGLVDHYYERMEQQQVTEGFQKYQPFILIRSYRNRMVKLPNPDNVTFAINKRSFPTTSKYQQVREAMIGAIKDWNNMCGVNFVYLEEYDTVLTDDNFTEELFFRIKQFNLNEKAIALSFNPLTKDPSSRIILIDSSFFTTKYNKQGVFRHELGHAMGFLHEHLLAPNGARCPDEGATEHFPIGQYDPKSVMHYFCETIGFGNRDLTFTGIDSFGAISVYPKQR